VDLPLVPVVQIERADPPVERISAWETDAVTAQPEQIFED
jgi:hypothetical protein